MRNSDNDILAALDNVTESQVKLTEWKRVDVEKKGIFFKRMQIVATEKTKEQFREILCKELREFRGHIERVKIQYVQSKKLKEILPMNHAICHMDFAENYACSIAEEVQSAYINKSAVTLHPVVIHTRNTENQDVQHKSIVVDSDELVNSDATVFAIIKNIIPEVKSILQNVQTIHYMTDSPTTQYRTTQFFSVITNHDKFFEGINATWLYFEAGHRKGPCDRVGGTAKRLADMAVKRLSSIIQSARDFLNGVNLKNTARRNTYLYLGQPVQKHLMNLLDLG
ncbi:hypothetical protein FSP39_004647 [Pinctada imbricata]|uniref:Uncharacterized protein n=1 Tax=Pinctada imbricata TaxID=66713 RepID=A0AA88YMA1_PINIB|nr:hypothetical protein FSP39_004647 [Pinctada imbricata]